MPRRRTKLQYIADDSSRRTTYGKRKAGLAKKLTEITVRCDLQACAILYSSFNEEADVWPQDPESFKMVLERYQTTSQQKKKELDLPAFTRQMIAKSQERLRKLTVENDMKEVAVQMNELLGGGGSAASTSLGNPNIMNVENMTSWIDEQMKAVANKLQEMDIAEPEIEPFVLTPPSTEVDIESYLAVPPPTEAEIEPYVPAPPPTESEIEPYVPEGPEQPPLTTN